MENNIITTENGIVCEGITKSFGEKEVLRDFTFTFPYGSVTAIMGSSGCGKTTLIRIIAGLETADSGTVKGVKREDIAILFQEDRLLPWLTALKNVETVITDKSRRGLAKEMLEALGLSGKDTELYPSELSGGMARRVSIARALCYLEANEKSVLILDEALRGLDKENLEKAVGIIKRYAKGKTVISVTHNRSSLEENADCILNME